MSMTSRAQLQDRYDPIGNFLGWLNENEIQAVGDNDSHAGASFVSLGAVKSYLERNHRDRLTDILNALFEDSGGPDHTDLLSNYLAVFCILLQIGRGRFIKHFVDHEIHDLYEFSPEHIPPKFPSVPGDEEFYQRFCEAQWRFCVPDFKENMNRVFHDRRTLPIVEKQPVATGGSAQVFTIKIHKSYDKLRGTHRVSSNANVYALKTYHHSPEARSYYENEVEAFRRLKDGRPHNPHLITFYGGYIHRGTYNIILEFADQGSLEDYFRHNGPPWKSDDIARFWTSLFGILKALDSIHTVERRNSIGELQILNGWHQDVKPRNILVVSNGSSSPYDVSFKLADLGISHFKRTIEGGAAVTDDDVSGTQTYAAPECFRSDDFWDRSTLRVKQDVDIFSLGCVFSESAVWLSRSYAGLCEYRDLRTAATNSISSNKRLGDCFHDGECVLEAVSETHRELPSTIRYSDHITAHVLGIIDDDMLSVSGSRLTAHLLWIRLEKIVNQANNRTTTRFSNGSDERRSGLYERNTPSYQIGPVAGPSRHVAPPPATLRSPFSTPRNGNRRNSRGAGLSNHNYLQEFDYKRTSSPEMISSPKMLGDGKLRDLSPGPHQRPATRPEARRSNLPSTRQSSGPFDHQSAVSGNGFHHQSPLIRTEHEPFGRLLEENDLSRNSMHQNTVHSLDPSSFRPNSERFVRDNNALGIFDQTPSGNGLRGTFSSNFPIRPVGGPAHSNQGTHRVAGSRIPSSNVNQVKGRRQYDLPHLSLGVALQWKMQRKKENNVLNKVLKREPKHKLPAEWLLYKCHARDHVFVIDDSVSMRPYWDEMCSLFEILSYMVKKSDNDGLDLFFTMSNKEYNVKDTRKLVQIVTERKSRLEGQSDVNIRLDQILGRYNSNLRNQIALRKQGSPYAPIREMKPLSVYVFTNAMWTNNSDPTPAIKSIVDSLIDLGSPRGQVGIQFISFGQDQECLDRLDRLDKGLGLKLDIVDHSPSNSGLWKMLLGAIDPEIDGDCDTENSSNERKSES